MGEKTLFTRIIEGEIPADIVYEDENFCAFRDIEPKAPTHVLVVPKKVIPRIIDADEADAELLGGLLLTANKVTRLLRISNEGFRYVINSGMYGGQLVAHLHLHILGGRQMRWPPG